MKQPSTVGQDFINCIIMKKPLWSYFVKFSLCIVAGYIMSIFMAPLLAVLIIVPLFIFIDLVLYRCNFNHCIDNIYHYEKDVSLFTDNNYSKDENGNPFNVYKLYIRNKSDNLHFYVYEYGRSEEEIFNFWLNNEGFKKKYCLYDVELVEERMNNDSNT